MREARQAGFDNINLDLMHGLPEQTPAMALADLERALSLEPEHLSWYQLTLEPNTAFFTSPPVLPEEELLWDIQDQGHAYLEAAGLRRYEISAYARPAGARVTTSITGSSATTWVSVPAPMASSAGGIRRAIGRSSGAGRAGSPRPICAGATTPKGSSPAAGRSKRQSCRWSSA